MRWKGLCRKRGKKNSSIGLDENIGGMLCYIFIIGLIFLFMEKENRFIRFHALQAVFLGVFLFILNLVFAVIPIIGLDLEFTNGSICVVHDCLYDVPII